LDLLEEVSPDKIVVHAFRLPFDFFNLKFLLKEKYSGKAADGRLEGKGTVDPDALRKGVFEEEWEEVPEDFQNAAEKVKLAMELEKDPVLIDVIVDQHRALRMEEIALENCVPFVCEYLKRTVDLVNIDAFLRWRWEKEEELADFERFIIKGGVLDGPFFKELYEEPLDTLHQRFGATPYAPIVEEGISYLSRHNSFTYLEKLCTDHKMAFLKKARNTPFGVEPLISYFLMKDFEMSALRTVLVGKANAIPYEQIKERLPGEYI
jgi:V/A-type H+-transporting ATPase subunit C